MTLKAPTQSWYMLHQLTHVVGQSRLYVVKLIVSGPGTYSPPISGIESHMIMGKAVKSS